MEQLLAALAETDDPVVRRIYLAAIARLEALDELERMPTQPLLDCAWCLREQGRPMGNGSHGICARHAREEEMKCQRVRIARRPTAALAA